VAAGSGAADVLDTVSDLVGSLGIPIDLVIQERRTHDR
jgi:hypothetical protein